MAASEEFTSDDSDNPISVCAAADVEAAAAVGNEEASAEGAVGARDAVSLAAARLDEEAETGVCSWADDDGIGGVVAVSRCARMRVALSWKALATKTIVAPSETPPLDICK